MSKTNNIWGTTAAVVNIESVIRDHLLNTGESFTSEEFVSAIAAEASEAPEKHFEGPAMSDDEWASL